MGLVILTGSTLIMLILGLLYKKSSNFRFGRLIVTNVGISFITLVFHNILSLDLNNIIGRNRISVLFYYSLYYLMVRLDYGIGDYKLTTKLIVFHILIMLIFLYIFFKLGGWALGGN